MLDQGGLMVVPAAPALATIYEDQQYYDALKESDFAILDSGYLCLALKVIKRYNAKKLSGLKFLREFIAELGPADSGDVFLIDPSTEESILNRQVFRDVGVDLKENQYVAPFYSENQIIDETLLAELVKVQPKYIVINLGGGVQERLGAYLKSGLQEYYNPSIICTGAAIAFLTKAQARIPNIIDAVYLGWLFRCISDPARFVPRYFGGIRLFTMLKDSKLEIE